MNTSSSDFLTPTKQSTASPAPSPSPTPSPVPAETPTTSLPAAYVADKAPEDGSKLRTLLSILRK